VTPKELLAQNMTDLDMVFSVFLKEFEETAHVEDKRRSDRLEQAVVGKKRSGKDLTRDLTSGPLVCPFLFTEASSEIVSGEGWLLRSHS